MAAKARSGSTVKRVMVYDRDGNGQLDSLEVLDMVDDIEKEEKQTREMRNQRDRVAKWLGGSLLVIMLLIAANFAVSWAVADLAKETHAEHTMLADSDHNVLRTAPARFGLPLYAAPVLGFGRFKDIDQVDVTLPCTAPMAPCLHEANGTLTVKIAYSVRERRWYWYSDVHAVLVLDNRDMTDLVIDSGGAALLFPNGSLAAEACDGEASCASISVDSEAEVERYMALADKALAAAHRKEDELGSDARETQRLARSEACTAVYPDTGPRVGRCR